MRYIKAFFRNAYAMLNSPIAFVLLVIVALADYFFPDSGSWIVQTIVGAGSRVYASLLAIVCVIALFHSLSDNRRDHVAKILALLVAIVFCVVVIVKPTTRTPYDPDLPPVDYPEIALITDIPTSDAMLSVPPTLNHDEIELDYENRTDANLVLFLLDCSKYYKNADDLWVSIAMPPHSESESPLRRFDGESNGWYSFVIRDLDSNQEVSVGSRQLFAKRQTRIIVTRAEPTIEADFD